PCPVWVGHQAPSTAHRPAPVRCSVAPSDDARRPAVRRQKTTGFRDKPEASEHAAPGSPARCETVKRLADALRPHPSSPPQALAAMLPCCRSSFSSSNEESTNILSVPPRLAPPMLASWNRSSSSGFGTSRRFRCAASAPLLSVEQTNIVRVNLNYQL